MVHTQTDEETPTIGIKPTDDPLARPAVPRDRGILIEMSGGEAGRVHCLRDTVLTLGRGKQCTLAFQDTTLSRTHARIQAIEGAYLLEDTGSLNGCFVNRFRETRAILAHGDRLRFGSGVSFQFQLVTPEEEAVLVHMYAAAIQDGLTGLVNRRSLDDHLKAEFAFAVRRRRELNVLIVDVDHFKKVNDTHGHLAGDNVLRQIADLLRAQARTEDLVARYGGEEFVVVARDVPAADACSLAERLRCAIEAHPFRFEQLTLRVTVSVGVSCLSKLTEKASVPRLLAAADVALYEAKAGGRNRVVIAPPQSSATSARDRSMEDQSQRAPSLASTA
ncbi:MAG: GGDEF domain-containing protein [Pseudomonadota bacterium]